MSEAQTQIQAVVGSAPDDLVAMYESGGTPSFPDSRINVLSFEAALSTTQQMCGIPAVDSLGLWVLDDANDSNPYGLITKGPYRGFVVHFSHDPEPEIKFDSLGGFLAEVQRVGQSGGDIDDFAPTIDQRLDCSDDIIRLVQEDTEDSIWMLCLYLTGSPNLSSSAQEAVAAWDDFYAGEALALWLKKHGSAADLAIAEKLAAADHPQVSNPGKAAVSAIRRRRSQQVTQPDAEDGAG